MNDLPVVRSPWRILILVLGFTFLYAPMLMLVIYSFNSSKLVTVWAGWSTRWYSELFHDDAMMSAVGLSLTIAACAAGSLLVFQSCLNVFGSVDILPLTGVTFPFVSNGGSAMLSAWGLLAYLKTMDTRADASFAIGRGPERKLKEEAARRTAETDPFREEAGYAEN